MPDYKETIIRIDHGAKTVHIWSEDAAVLRKLDLSGAEPEKAHSGQHFRICTLDRFRWRIIRKNLKRQATAAQLAALAKARAKRQGQVPPASTTST